MNSLHHFILGLGLASGASAATVFPDSSLALAIPDHDATGILRSLTVTSLTAGAAYDVTVALDIEGTGYGGYIGDLYAYLAHQTPLGSSDIYDMVVLLNRPGRSASLLTGYDDTGLNITLSDQAATDIHTYQSGSPVVDAAGVLSGVWQPDRRLFDPDMVTDASGRAVTTLDSLVNGDANGNWYLYIADLETGGTMQLNAWSLRFSEVSAVPEPASALSVAGMLASALLLRSRKRLNRSS
jgi:hypothetical protein